MVGPGSTDPASCRAGPGGSSGARGWDCSPCAAPASAPPPHTWHAPHPPAAGPSPARLRRPSGGLPVGRPPLPRQPWGPLAAASQGFSKRPALTPTLAPPRSGHPLRPEPSGQRLSGLCLRGAVRPLGGQRDHCRAPSAEPPGRAGLWTAGMAPGPRVAAGGPVTALGRHPHPRCLPSLRLLSIGPPRPREPAVSPSAWVGRWAQRGSGACPSSQSRDVAETGPSAGWSPDPVFLTPPQAPPLRFRGFWGEYQRAKMIAGLPGAACALGCLHLG